MYENNKIRLNHLMLIIITLAFSLANQSFAATDIACQNACTAKDYSLSYCQQACSYNGTNNNVPEVGSAWDGFNKMQNQNEQMENERLKNDNQRLENERLKLEIERLKAKRE